MNTEQMSERIEIANTMDKDNVPHGKFTMTWNPETGNWTAKMEAFLPTDAIINALSKMGFSLHMANFGVSMDQQAKAQQHSIEVAGNCPPPPQFQKQRR